MWETVTDCNWKDYITLDKGNRHPSYHVILRREIILGLVGSPPMKTTCLVLI